ncbi:MAG: hypothetical protein AWM53_01536 [Candidatus Dichloromethanomonas elyunquensis]|nr:MAG: hypothetical protein AWM53_01536 [Candidatus Dichloromethanomonas elyunquensis]
MKIRIAIVTNSIGTTKLVYSSTDNIPELMISRHIFENGAYFKEALITAYREIIRRNHIKNVPKTCPECAQNVHDMPKKCLKIGNL